jgi:predicted ATPase
MHPGALRLAAQVFGAAVKRGVQVVLSTHSLELIDALVDAASNDDLARLSLHRVQLADGELLTSRLAGDDVSLARFEIASDLR